MFRIWLLLSGLLLLVVLGHPGAASAVPAVAAALAGRG